MGINKIEQKQPRAPQNCQYHNMIKTITDIPFYKDYNMKEIIGKGSYAEVYKGQSIKTKKLKAVKKIDRRKHAKIEPLLMNEFQILKELDHPNVLKAFHIYEQPTFYYIVTELCTGKQLFQIIKQKKYFSEQEACEIFYQLISAVMHMHSKNIMHRDLKPENMMYNPQTRTLKIIDFGSACIFQTKQLVQRRRVGTSYYIAPEVLTKSYNHKCDIWSIGVILYVLLAGEPPFKGKQDEQILSKVKEGVFDFKSQKWNNISPEAKMLVTDLLKKKPEDRPESIDIMNHQWIKKNLKKEPLNKNNENSIAHFLANMQKFKDVNSNTIQEGVLVFIVNFVQKGDDQGEMLKCFKQLDLNGDGQLSLEQLTIGLGKYLSLPQKQSKKIAEGIFKKVDTNYSGFIDYSQFLVSATNIQMAVSQQNLDLAFDFIDKDKNGFLSASELQQKLGDNIEQAVYKTLMKQYKLNKDGEISKKDFISMMQKLLKKK